MKKSYLILIFVAGVLFNACAPDFLNVEPKGKAFEENYYTLEEEVFKGLNAAYDFLVLDFTYDHGYSSSYMMRNIASDDGNAGGGNANDIADWQAIDEFRPTLIMVRFYRIGKEVISVYTDVTSSLTGNILNLPILCYSILPKLNF